MFEYGKTKQYFNIKDHSTFKQMGLDIYIGQFYTFEMYDIGLRMVSDISNRIV